MNLADTETYKHIYNAFPEARFSLRMINESCQDCEEDIISINELLNQLARVRAIYKIQGRETVDIAYEVKLQMPKLSVCEPRYVQSVFLDMMGINTVFRRGSDLYSVLVMDSVVDRLLKYISGEIIESDIKLLQWVFQWTPSICLEFSITKLSWSEEGLDLWRYFDNNFKEINKRLDSLYKTSEYAVNLRLRLKRGKDGGTYRIHGKI